MTTQPIHLVPTADGLEPIPTVIIGGSQAGLVMGYHLKNAGEQFVILDAQPRIGDAWRNRWDSLRLFTPPKYSSLPGWPMRLSTFPTQVEMGDYLEDYARHFELPVRCGVRVNRLFRSAEGFRLETSKGLLLAERVVIATGGYDVPAIPDFAAALASETLQLHSAAYRNPDQLIGNILVVGAGNSGAEIALEAVRSGHQTWLAGRHPGQVPFRIEGRLGRALLPIVAFMFRRVLTLDTPIGRKARRNTLGHGKPLVRTKLSDLQAAGVRRIDRIAGIREGRPVTEGGHVLEPQTVVWCTGYHPDYSWIELPVTDSSGHAINERGVSAEAGLYFIGAEFQYALASATIQGLDQDARYLMEAMAERPTTRPAATPARAAA